jgi:integrase
VPLDLQSTFQSSEVKKSLKTKDRAAAKEEAVSVEFKVFNAFRQIRSGLFSDHQVSCIVSDLVPKRNGRRKAGVRLSDVMKAYAKEHEQKWGQKTRLENLGSYRLITDVIGDIEVRAITKQTTMDLRDKISKLPANMYKIYPDKSIKQILKIPNITPMSTTTVNKHVFRLSTILNYSVKEGYIQINFAEKMKISIKRRQDEERKTYSREDVANIVKALPLDPDKPERFWIALIACFTGLRLDEICQLYVEDVQQVDGIWCVSVNDEKDKKVKSLSGKRVVPLHPALLSSGLLRYVEELRVSGVPRLWMNLQWREADGYSNAFGKWFQRFNRQHVTDDPQKVFHSMRHLVTDSLKQAGVQEIVIAEIIGHANDSMTTGRYGKRYQPKVLLEALMQLDYGVELPVWKI